MEITDIRIRRNNSLGSAGSIKAVVSISFDDVFVVHDLKIIDGQYGLFVAMPARKTSKGFFRDIAHPLNTEMREYIQKRVLDEFEKLGDEEPEEE